MNRNLLLALGAVLLAAAPMVLYHGSDTEFAGADGEAQAAISVISPDYKPWAAPIWQPPGKETESLLFALQAALGAGLVGFYFGRRSAARSK